MSLSYDTMQQKILTSHDVILYALYVLGGTTQKVHTEDIASKCFKLLPSQFSWIKYANYPSLEAVRRPLIQVRSNEGGTLVLGRHGRTKEDQVAEGWIFTPQGIKWIEQNKERIARQLDSPLDRPKKRTDVDKKIYEIKNSSAFKKFLKDKNCSNVFKYEFTNFLNASIDTPSPILRDRLVKIRAIAYNQEEIIEFLNLAEKKFADLLRT